MENNLDDANMEHQDANISPGMTQNPNILPTDTTPSASQVWLKTGSTKNLVAENQVSQRPRTAVNVKNAPIATESSGQHGHQIGNGDNMF